MNSEYDAESPRPSLFVLMFGEVRLSISKVWHAVPMFGKPMWGFSFCDHRMPEVWKLSRCPGGQVGFPEQPILQGIIKKKGT